jgi:hypothetical protein
MQVLVLRNPEGLWCIEGGEGGKRIMRSIVTSKGVAGVNWVRLDPCFFKGVG